MERRGDTAVQERDGCAAGAGAVTRVAQGEAASLRGHGKAGKARRGRPRPTRPRRHGRRRAGVGGGARVVFVHRPAGGLAVGGTSERFAERRA